PWTTSARFTARPASCSRGSLRERSPRSPVSRQRVPHGGLGHARRDRGARARARGRGPRRRSEEHTSELQSRFDLVCRLLLDKENKSRWTDVRRRIICLQIRKIPPIASEHPIEDSVTICASVITGVPPFRSSVCAAAHRGALA